MEHVGGCNSVYQRSPVKMQLLTKKKRCLSEISARLKYFVLTLILFSIQEAGFSQSDSIQKPSAHDSTKVNYDSAKNKLFNYIKQFGDSEQRKNVDQYSEDTIATRQDETIALIKKLTLEAQNYVDNGLDTTGLTNELNQIENWYSVTSDGVFTNTGTIQTHRNLETSYKIMRELLIRITERKSSLDNYYNKLVQFRNTIDSLYQQDILYKFSSDSTVLKRYAGRLTIVLQEVTPIHNSLRKTLTSVSELQPTINIMVNKLTSSIAQIEMFQRELSTRTFDRETSSLGGPVRYVRRFDEIVNFSMRKAGLSFIFYVNNAVGKIILLSLLVVVCGILLLYVKRNIQKEDLLDKNDREQSVLKYPFLSALLVVLNVFQFIFIDPPFVFSAVIWILSGLSLTFMLRNVVAKYWMAAWLIMFVLFLFACFDNLILQASRPERWMMVALSVAGIICGTVIMVKGPRRDPREKLLFFFIGFVVVMQIASILSNTYGRYNLAKTSLTAGFFNVVLAILFFWTLQFIYQGLALARRIYGRPDRESLNLEVVRPNRAPALFYVLLFIGWFVLFARNFYASKFISVPLKNFVLQKRTIGDFSFSIGNVLEFFLILYISTLLSRTVSFLASQKPGQVSTGRKGIGSWLLVIRITIMTIGVLVAFAAIGIPMDRLTIILSALSVGIGFGLQSLVNNLVSGLIISFEKPVSVGDTVEIGGQSGTVKSVGFRSSIIVTAAGANVVIPNGDLLNQHLINWTHDKTSRGIDIPVGVAYGTNLDQAMKILKELPAKDERILAYPSPTVIIKQFNSSSIDMQLTFWVRNITELLFVKSDIILAIDHAFKQNSIKIPFPQQEVHVSSVLKRGDSN